MGVSLELFRKVLKLSFRKKEAEERSIDVDRGPTK